MYSFSYLELVCCSMSSSTCCSLTCIQVSQEAGQVVWYSHLFQNFPHSLENHKTNLELLKGIKTIRNGKHMGKYKRIFFSIFKMKKILKNNEISYYYRILNTHKIESMKGRAQRTVGQIKVYCSNGFILSVKRYIVI